MNKQKMIFLLMLWCGGVLFSTEDRFDFSADARTCFSTFARHNHWDDSALPEWLNDVVGICGVRGKEDETMKDTVAVQCGMFPGGTHGALFMAAVFDGHGRSVSVAQCCAQHLFKAFLKDVLHTSIQDIIFTFDKSHFAADAEHRLSGATAGIVLVFISPKGAISKVCIIHLGDTKIAAYDQYGRCLYETEDHILKGNLKEQKRVVMFGGTIEVKDGHMRVNGKLIPSRAFGNFNTKGVLGMGDVWIGGESYLRRVPDYPIGIVPFIRVVDKSAELGEVTAFLIASDGLWDVCEPEELYYATAPAGLPDRAYTMVQVAYDKNSRDNITAVILNIPNLRKALQDHPELWHPMAQSGGATATAAG